MTLDNFPNQRPIINLDFQKSKSLDPRISFGRDSIGTFKDKDDNIKTARSGSPRFEWVNGVCQGLLIEEPRTNRWTNSQVFSSGWTPNDMGTPTDNAAIAPDGTNTAASVFETATTNTHFIISSQIVPSASAALSWSIFVKANGRDYVIFYIFQRFNIAGFYSVCVDLTTGDIAKELDSTNAGGFHFYDFTSKVTPCGNGWYRIEVGFRTQNNNGIQAHIFGATGPDPTFGSGGYPTDTYAGDATKGYYLWGFQVEDAKFATSYIPTAGSTVTRAVDLVTFSNNNFTDWFNNSQGTWVLDVDVLGSSDDYPRLLQTNQSHNFEYQTLNSAPTAKSLAFQQWLTGQSTKTPYGIAPLGEFKTAAGYSIGNLSPIYIDGTEQVRGIFYSPGTAIGTPPTELRIFRQSNGGQFLSGVLSSMRYYPTHISDTALEVLTL